MTATLGVYITTHLTTPSASYRHGGRFADRQAVYFEQTVLANYTKFCAGVEATVTIMDTGSDKVRLEEAVAGCPDVGIQRIPNTGGGFSSLKYCMGNPPDVDYLFFHVDDGVEVVKENWGISLIDDYKTYNAESDLRMGILGRMLDNIRLGPGGLIDHRNCCKHIAKMWGIQTVLNIPHLHGDWWFMDRATLTELGRVWYDPVMDVEAMEFQRAAENRDYVELHNLGDNRQLLDAMHIGREVDTPLRLGLIARKTAGYRGDAIYARQLHKRSG